MEPAIAAAACPLLAVLSSQYRCFVRGFSCSQVCQTPRCFCLSLSSYNLPPTPWNPAGSVNDGGLPPPTCIWGVWEHLLTGFAVTVVSQVTILYPKPPSFVPYGRICYPKDNSKSWVARTLLWVSQLVSCGSGV